MTDKMETAQENPEEDLVLLDFEKALERAMGDKDFLNELFQEFNQTIPLDMAVINEKLAGGDADGLRATAHRIKGYASNLSLLKIADIAFRLEKASMEDDFPATANLIKRLDNAIEQTVAHIESLG